ncbi:MAG: hypothetical protein ACYTFN_22950, partial [Planctomycetota bacterium]
PRLEAIGCPDPGGLYKILDRYVFYHGAQGPGIKALGQVLAAIFPHPDQGELGPGTLAFYVRWALSDSYVRAPANRLAVWAGVRPPASELLAQIRRSGPRQALQTARQLWLRAMRGENLFEAIPTLEEALSWKHQAPAVPFFLSCAWRHYVSIWLRGADLPPLILPAQKRFPKITYETSVGFCSTLTTSRGPRHKKWKQTPTKHRRHPGKERCQVCAGRETTCIYHEFLGDLTGSWRLNEHQCTDCGCHTLYKHDDY